MSAVQLQKRYIVIAAFEYNYYGWRNNCKGLLSPRKVRGLWHGRRDWTLLKAQQRLYITCTPPSLARSSVGTSQGIFECLLELNHCSCYSKVQYNPTTVFCSSNILLDECLQPKLSDFGMARLRPHTVNQSWTITMVTGPRSNLAYLPEEYIRDGKLSVKLDIYSLGMVSFCFVLKNLRQLLCN